ncbi:MAG: RdgB/HAM1 family non-canonical purine NTP pyrophosphatase [Synergistaceae bacterium]|nr:RdgB/HAM1 family non-canonical purine NTP pyrophosphatase [Synergistaceae bacterium]
MRQIVFASTNRGKYKEFKKSFAGLPVEFLFAGDFENQKKIEVEETGSSYEENAILKAKAYAESLGLTALADDSGLEVAALDGKPGIYSARMGNTDQERLSWLLTSLDGQENRAAQFMCAIALVEPNGVTQTVRGTCQGKIIAAPQGESGFGYDPVFVPNGYDKTFAELGIDVKDKISHRANAIKKIKEILK